MLELNFKPSVLLNPKHRILLAAVGSDFYCLLPQSKIQIEAGDAGRRGTNRRGENAAINPNVGLGDRGRMAGQQGSFDDSQQFSESSHALRRDELAANFVPRIAPALKNENPGSRFSLQNRDGGRTSGQPSTHDRDVVFAHLEIRLI